MDIRDLMELGDFVSSAAAPHFTTLEISTDGLLLRAWDGHPSAPHTRIVGHKLTRQQVHDMTLSQVKDVVRGMWDRHNAAPAAAEITTAKPVCTECRGTGLDDYDPPRCDQASEPAAPAAPWPRQGSCLMCDGRGWVVQAPR